MATIPPSISDLERRLLREYRLTSIPSRRSSCSPATSNASSSTNTNLSDHHLELPHLTTADNSRLQPNIPGCEYFQLTSPNQHHQRDSIEQDNRLQFNAAARLQSIRNQLQHQQQQQQMRINSIHQYQNYKIRNNPLKLSPRNRSGNGLLKAKQSKATTLTQELSPDELNRVLDLVSQLGYLKLVSPKDVIADAQATTTNNKIYISPTSIGDDEFGLIGSEGSSLVRKPHLRHNSNVSVKNFITNDGLKSELNYDNSVNRASYYIFEKVNYIKRMKQRKRALKELKKVKTRSKKSPERISECPKTQNTRCDP